MKWLGLTLAIIFTAASLVLTVEVISNSVANQQNKSNYAELNHVKYGLLSVDEWKRQIAAILFTEINHLDLTKSNERDLRQHLMVLLNTLIDKLKGQIRDSNTNSLGGWIKQSFTDTLINWDDVKKGIPDYVNAVMQEIEKPQTKKQIRGLLRQQLQQFSDKTYEPSDYDIPLKHVLEMTGSKSVAEARHKVDQDIKIRQKIIVRDSLAIIVLAVLLFGLSGLSRQPLTPARYLLLVAALVMLLVVGVTTPTIDIDARITDMSFVVMGHPIQFENQILYFQSKSLLDVFRILMSYKEQQMKFVAVLLITFSVIFPALKILSSFAFYFNLRRARQNPIVRFFVLHSGKWSMTDVMVVAIFMAYIGFNSMIIGMFGQMRGAGGPGLNMITTNGTALQPGYYVFLTYTLLALVLAMYLKRKPPRNAKPGGEGDQGRVFPMEKEEKTVCTN